LTCIRNLDFLTFCLNVIRFVQIFILWNFLIVSGVAGKIPDSSPLIYATRTEIPPTLDGILNETVWISAARIDSFIQREPADGQPGSEITIVYLCYDDENLYFAFDCRDSQAPDIIATEMRRDESLLNNDCIEIYLDTYHDHRTAFYFSTNPLGAKRDGIVMTELNTMAQNWDWNGVWHVATSEHENGWIAEIAIPFKTLRFRSETEMYWGLNLARFIPRKREEMFWAPIARDYGYWGKYKLSVFGHLSGLRSVQHSVRWELKPFILGGTGRDFTEFSAYENEFEIGLDAHYLLTSNLTATLTVNTDFAQVEADQEQINLTQYELFLPEKREFFLEGANTFTFGERSFSFITQPNLLFFSRRIGLSEDNEITPLLGGIKLTGKEGPFNIGFLNIVADRISYRTDDDEPVSIPQTNYTAMRISRDIFSNSSVGFIGLNKQSLEGLGYTRNFGIDANIYLAENTQMGGFLASSHKPFLTGKNFAGYLDFNHMDDFFNVFLSQSSIQENFTAEMGYLPRTGVRTTQFNAGISPRPDVFDIRQIFIFDNLSYITDQTSTLETRINLIGTFTEFENGAGFFAGYVNNYEKLSEEFEIHDGIVIPIERYIFDYYMIEYQSDRSKPIAGSLGYTSGEFFNGSLNGYMIRGYIKAGRHLTMNLDYTHDDVRLPAGNFITRILSARIVYSFSPSFFIKPFIQWNSDTQIITSNFLLNFIHRPGSDLFIVYNEELDVSGPRFHTENRTILLKFTYLFSF
jgi:hypothetical protein